MTRQVTGDRVKMHPQTRNMLRPNRRSENDALGGFLRSLDINCNSALRSLFHCSKCEVQTQGHTRQLRAVVLDGTATGVLGELPEYRRDSIEFPLATNETKGQFILRLTNRSFISALICGCRRNSLRESFDMELSGDRARKRTIIVRELFDSEYESTRITEVVRFLHACYRLEGTGAYDKWYRESFPSVPTSTSAFGRVWNIL